MARLSKPALMSGDLSVSVDGAGSAEIMLDAMLTKDLHVRSLGLVEIVL